MKGVRAVYPKAYIDFLVVFHGERDYFECHELMEEFWKQERGTKLSGAWLGLIQLSVFLYHQRRGNIAGARKMLDSAITHLQSCDLRELGIDGELFIELLNDRRAVLKIGNSDAGKTALYMDLNIPLTDSLLIGLCMEECRRRGLQWGAPSPMDKDILVHKHLLRDRSEVVKKRKAALDEKQGKRRREP